MAANFFKNYFVWISISLTKLVCVNRNSFELSTQKQVYQGSPSYLQWNLYLEAIYRKDPP